MATGRMVQAPRAALLAGLLSLLLLPPASATDEAPDLAGDLLIAEIQMELNEYGYDAGPEDGVLGQATISAIRRFQADQGLRATGRIDAALLARIADPREGARGGSGPERDGSASQRDVGLWMERNFRRTVGAFEAAPDGPTQD